MVGGLHFSGRQLCRKEFCFSAEKKNQEACCAVCLCASSNCLFFFQLLNLAVMLICHLKIVQFPTYFYLPSWSSSLTLDANSVHLSAIAVISSMLFENKSLTYMYLNSDAFWNVFLHRILGGRWIEPEVQC